MSFVKDSFEGLLEGHEGGGVKTMYKLMMFTLVVLSIVGAILPLVAEEICGMPYLLSAVVIGLLGIILTMIRWHREDGMPAKNKKLIYALMALLLLLNVYCITTHEMYPDTSCPCNSYTPTPTNPPPRCPCLKQPVTAQCIANVDFCLDFRPTNCSAPPPTPIPSTPR